MLRYVAERAWVFSSDGGNWAFVGTRNAYAPCHQSGRNRIRAGINCVGCTSSRRSRELKPMRLPGARGVSAANRFVLLIIARNPQTKVPLSDTFAASACAGETWKDAAPAR